MRDAVLNAFGINRAYGAQLLADIPADQFTHQPAGLKNHPAWTVGHLAVSLDAAADLLGGGQELPENWSKLFGMGSQPTGDAAAYPDKATLVASLESQCERVAAAYESATPGQLAGQTPEAFRNMLPTVEAAIVFLLTGHHATHLGQLSSWRRAMGMDFALPSDRDLAAQA
jgi:hypothetical protein